MNWYIEGLKKYATFSGRARRKEYWMFYLFHVLAMMILSIPAIISLANSESEDASMGLLSLPIIYFIGTIIPWIALTTRRLHDSNRSGWWQLISFIPYVGGIVLFIFTLFDGTAGDNDYGPDPKGREGLSMNGSKINPSNLDTLERLHELKEKGVITQEEYEAKKSELL